jgi:hypothetical protein
LENLIDDLKEDTAAIEKRLAERLADLAELKVVDEDSASRATEVAGDFLRISQTLEAERKRQGKPFAEQVDAVNGHYNILKARADDAKVKAAGYVDAWRDRMKKEADERRQKAEAEAARLRAEAQKAIEAGQIHGDSIAEKLQEAQRLETVAETQPETPIVRGTYGASASARKVNSFEITDFDKALDHFKSNSLITEALDKAIAAAIRAKQTDIPGVKIVVGSKTVIRT